MMIKASLLRRGGGCFNQGSNLLGIRALESINICDFSFFYNFHLKLGKFYIYYTSKKFINFYREY